MTQKSIATQSLWKEGVRGEFKLNTKNLFFDKPYPQRFKEHKKWWLENEEDMQVYLGRIYEPKLHSKKNNWKTWERDVGLSENILIYKYSPNYNSTGISDEPSLSPFKKFKLIHRGKRHRLEPEDIAPDDYQ
jgi:hypothetical protein